jgi:hypothetical protein
MRGMGGGMEGGMGEKEWERRNGDMEWEMEWG